MSRTASEKRKALLEKETKEANTFMNNRSSRYPSRAKAVAPTLEELRSKTFTEYVRSVLFEDSSDSESESEDDNEAKDRSETADNKEMEQEDRVNESICHTASQSEQAACTPTNGTTVPIRRSGRKRRAKIPFDPHGRTNTGLDTKKKTEPKVVQTPDSTPSGGVKAAPAADTPNQTPVEWKNGIVKITLPEGWWDEAGIGKDRTGRGPAVSHNTVQTHRHTEREREKERE